MMPKPLRYAFNTSVFVLLVMWGTSCSEKEGVKEEEKHLVIHEDTLFFSYDVQMNTLLMANVGKDTINWKVSQKPAWLYVNQEAGALQTGAGKIQLEVDVSVSKGVYFDVLEINSDGGNYAVYVKFENYLPNYQVTPGQGITSIFINDSYAELKKLFGEPDSIGHVRVASDSSLQYAGMQNKFFFVHTAYYPEQGLAFNFTNYNKTNIFVNDRVAMIDCYYPFNGSTKNGLQLGSSLDKIELYLGAADYNETSSFDGYDVNIFRYSNLGVDFYFTNNNFTSVQYISIYLPAQLVENDLIKFFYEEYIKDVKFFLTQ